MFRSLSNSLELFKASARVLRADKELLIFPIISTLGVIAVSFLFFVPIALSGLLNSIVLQPFNFFFFISLFLFYVAQYCVIFFANTALVGAALIRIRGGDPTVSDGFRIAASRFIPILGYAVLAATVGMLLKLVSERSRGLGRMVIAIVGMAWNVGTYLVVPILAVEDVGPIEAVRRSVELLKKTWGEQLVGNLGLGAITAFFSIALVFIGAAFTAFAFALGLSLWLIVLVLIVLVFLLVMLGLINSTLTGIYTAAVYVYAADDQLEGFFDPDLIEGAFRQR